MPTLAKMDKELVQDKINEGKVYLGRIKNTNKSARYVTNNLRGTCKRVSPVFFDYVLPSLEDLTVEMVKGNYKMLENTLDRANLKGRKKPIYNSIIVQEINFSSTDEGIRAYNKDNNQTYELKSPKELNDFIVKLKEGRKSLKKSKKSRSKVSMSVNRVKEKETWEKFKHLMP